MSRSSTAVQDCADDLFLIDGFEPPLQLALLGCSLARNQKNAIREPHPDTSIWMRLADGESMTIQSKSSPS
jgi:hypothetical protein